MTKKTKQTNPKVIQSHKIYLAQIDELKNKIDQCKNQKKLDELKEDFATLKDDINHHVTGKNSNLVKKAFQVLEKNWNDKATSFKPVIPYDKLTKGQREYMPKEAIKKAKQVKKENKAADIQQDISKRELEDSNPPTIEFSTPPPEWHEIAEHGSKIILSKEELYALEHPQELKQVSPKPVIEAREKQLDTFMGYVVTLNVKYEKFKETRDKFSKKIDSGKFSKKDKESLDAYSRACLAAYTLIDKLSTEHKNYVSDEKINITTFRKNCIEHIEKAGELQKHRGFLKPLAGLLESIASLIMSTAPGTLFDKKIKIKTNTEKKLDSLITHLNELIEPTKSSESTQANSTDSSMSQSKP